MGSAILCNYPGSILSIATSTMRFTTTKLRYYYDFYLRRQVSNPSKDHKWTGHCNQLQVWRMETASVSMRMMKYNNLTCCTRDHATATASNAKVRFECSLYYQKTYILTVMYTICVVAAPRIWHVYSPPRTCPQWTMTSIGTIPVQPKQKGVNPTGTKVSAVKFVQRIVTLIEEVQQCCE